MADSTLYFIRRKADGAIKIGITTDLGRRVPDLQRQHGAMTVLRVAEDAATRGKLAYGLHDERYVWRSVPAACPHRSRKMRTQNTPDELLFLPRCW